MKGISQLLRDFRRVVEENNIMSIAYAGIPGFCQPFAELFAYVIKNKENYFIPYTDLNNVKILTLKENIGMQMEDFGKIDYVDALVIFGGLAMPKFNVSEEEVRELILKLSPKITIGVGFMDIFKKVNWKIKFDYL
ncbi:hypothetical protein J422_05289, partial [Methanocaldococcus villosus KIN24-T80]